MSRQQINRAAEMAIFVAVVDTAGFSTAARKLKLTPSAISKLIARLEARLGTRLLHRSTRQLQPTPEGAAFYARCVRILEEIDSAEREAANCGTPRGTVRINCFVPFAVHFLYPILPEFLARYPGIRVDVTSAEAVIDLLRDGTDIAVRAGPLKDSALTARKLGQGPMAVLASPAYLARHGTPRTPADLAQHNLLGFNFRNRAYAWPFKDGSGGVRMVAPDGNALLGDGEGMRHVALAGLGLARLSRMHARADLAAGTLVPVLEQYNPGDLEEWHAVFLGPGQQVPPRVRVMLDYLLEKIRFD